MKGEDFASSYTISKWLRHFWSIIRGGPHLMPRPLTPDDWVFLVISILAGIGSLFTLLIGYIGVLLLLVCVGGFICFLIAATGTRRVFLCTVYSMTIVLGWVGAYLLDTLLVEESPVEFDYLLFILVFGGLIVLISVGASVGVSVVVWLVRGSHGQNNVENGEVKANINDSESR